MDPTQQANPDVLAMLQALQGNNPQAGMAPPQGPVPPGSEFSSAAQQASMGNGLLGQQAQAAGMYGPLATPPPMTPPPVSPY